MVQGKSQAMGVRQLPGQGERLVAPFEGLVWIAKRPQGRGRKSQGGYSGVKSIEEGMRAVLLRVVEDQALFKVL